MPNLLYFLLLRSLIYLLFDIKTYTFANKITHYLRNM